MWSKHECTLIDVDSLELVNLPGYAVEIVTLIWRGPKVSMSPFLCELRAMDTDYSLCSNGFSFVV